MKSKLATNSFFEVHTLARVILSNSQIKLSWLGADCVKDMIEKKAGTCELPMGTGGRQIYS